VLEAPFSSSCEVVKKGGRGREQERERAHLLMRYVKRRWPANDRKSGHLVRWDASALRPTVVAHMRVELEAIQPIPGLDSGRLGPRLGGSAHPYKFA
jgi:hypothetical protein